MPISLIKYHEQLLKNPFLYKIIIPPMESNFEIKFTDLFIYSY